MGLGDRRLQMGAVGAVVPSEQPSVLAQGDEPPIAPSEPRLFSTAPFAFTAPSLCAKGDGQPTEPTLCSTSSSVAFAAAPSLGAAIDAPPSEPTPSATSSLAFNAPVPAAEAKPS